MRLTPRRSPLAPRSSSGRGRRSVGVRPGAGGVALEGRLLLSVAEAVGPWGVAEGGRVGPGSSVLVRFAPGASSGQEASALDAVGGRVARSYPDGPSLVALAPW